MNRTLFFIMISGLMLTSCIQKKQLLYMQDIEHDPPGTYTLPEFEYRIQKGDILYVKINTLDQAYQAMFESDQASQQRFTTAAEAQMYLTGYTVDKSGNIELPVLGKIDVENKTTEQAREAVQEKLDNYFKEARAEVKLVNYKITVTGEVGSPGVYINYQNQVTVFDAIAQAGNITDFGNRQNVLVLRPGENGTQSFRMDLTNTSALSSEGYFLRPNDMVFVEPNNTKVFRLNTPTVTFAFSALSTLLLIINFLQ